MSRSHRRLSLLLCVSVLASLAVPFPAGANAPTAADASVDAAAVGDVTWEWLNPEPTPHQLDGIDFVGTKGWAVGDQGVIITTADDGSTWTTQREAVSSWPLRAVSFGDASNGVAVGGNAVLNTDDGGVTWTTQVSPYPTTFTSVDMADATTGMMTGYRTVFSTSDGGASWSPALEATTTVSDVVHVSGSTYWAVGASGMFHRTTDGGATWSSSAIATSTASLSAVTVVPGDASKGFAVGQSYSPYHTHILATEDGGTTWSEVSLPAAQHYTMPLDVTFADSSSGYVIGMYQTLTTSDGGATWSNVYPIQPCNAVAINSLGEGILVGDYGAIFRDVGGAGYTPIGGFTRQSIWGSDFISPEEGWLVGGNGLVAHTQDGGQSWDFQDLGHIASAKAVDFVDPLNGFAVAATVLYGTSDGGSSWEASTPISGNYNAVSRPTLQDAYVVGNNGLAIATHDAGATWSDISTGSVNLNDAHFVDNTTGWAVGRSGTILRTLDGGQSWEAQASGTSVDLQAVRFVDGSAGWAVGGSGTLLRTADGGETWTQVTSPVLEWWKDVALATQDEVWICSNRTVYRSQDGGDSWQKQLGLSNTVQTLTTLSSPDPSTVFFAGPGGWLARGDVEMPPPPLPTEVTYLELGGDDRFETAVLASQDAFPEAGTAGAVVIATGMNWPDALGAASLAGAYDAPVLLTAKDSLPKAVAREIGRLSVNKAFIIGSTDVVSTEVEKALGGLVGGSGNVERLEGRDRYGTSAAVAAAVKSRMTSLGAWDGRVFVATGLNFPDALAASPLASAKGIPTLLVAGDRIPSAIDSSLKSMSPTEIVILGGTPAVSKTVQSSLAKLAPTDRLFGDDRYETGIAIAQYAVSEGLAWDGVAIATGENFPDALAGGAAQGVNGAVVVLTPTDSLHRDVRDQLAANKGAVFTVRFLGGPPAVSEKVRESVRSTLD